MRKRGSDPVPDAGTLVPLEPPQILGLAVYVLGEGDGARFLLPKSGSTTIGRDPGCEIVLDHPMVSRRHATVHLGSELILEDLRSSNGTSVGKQRLLPGERRILDVEQSFSVGSTTLVVHQHRLPTLTSGRVITPTQMLERIDRNPGSFALLKMTLERPVEPRWMEAILAQELGPGDLIVPLRDLEVAVFRPQATPATSAALVEACRREMSRWGIPSHGEVCTFSEGEPVRPAAVEFLFGTQMLDTSSGSIILGDPEMAKVYRVIDRVAPTVVNVLILGETGVGKEVVASQFHERSLRRDKPFLKINCATLSESLLESELFGHEKGAFTGALAAKVGLLERADGGTVFLDELGEMPLKVQAKLLRVVETRELTRVGGLKSKTVDLRFIAASNRDLDDEVERGAFRRDLFYRLNTVQLHIPALRERPSEIIPLALHFLKRASRTFGIPGVSFSTAALGALKAYSWPGSIRQLRNVVERSVLLGSGSVLEPEELGLPRTAVLDGDKPIAAPASPSKDPQALPAAEPAQRSHRDKQEQDERQKIVEALNVCNGNQSRAAVLLKMPRRTLVRKISRYLVPRPRGPFSSGSH